MADIRLTTLAILHHSDGSPVCTVPEAAHHAGSGVERGDTGYSVPGPRPIVGAPTKLGVLDRK